MGTMKGVSALSFLQHVLHREIPSSMFGCLSGGWSLVVGQLQLQTWPWGVQVLWQTLVFEAFFTLLRLFYPPEAKQNSCGVIFCLRGLRRFLFASGVSRYVLSGSTFYERFSGVDFVMWCIPDPRNFYSTLILARFNVFCSVEGKLPEFARLVSALLDSFGILPKLLPRIVVCARLTVFALV